MLQMRELLLKVIKQISPGWNMCSLQYTSISLWLSSHRTILLFIPFQMFSGGCIFILNLKKRQEDHSQPKAHRRVTPLTWAQKLAFKRPDHEKYC